ncbi:hypothetical protein K469DRAFT_569032, partial [Zopfia rhizophila CBS 207.26]
YNAPSNLPDLNPIENVWRLLKYRIRKRGRKTDAEVRQYLEEEWENKTIDDILKNIKEVAERVQAVIAANGGYTKY